MKALAAFTRRSLKKNRTRTIITIIGITISMIMLVVVTLGAVSGKAFFEGILLNKEGSYHAYWHGLSDQEVQAARSLPNQEKSSVWKEVGLAQVPSKNTYKPYLQIFAVDGEAQNLAAINIVEGRMPAKEGELLLPTHLKDNGGLSYKVGEPLNLEVGKRQVNGVMVSNDPAEENVSFQPNREKLVQTRKKTYQVVGYYKRLSTDLEGYHMPAYMALTVGEAGGPSLYLLRFQDINKGLEHFQQRNQPKDDKYLSEKYEETKRDPLKKLLWRENFHSDLLLLQASSLQSPVNQFIGALAVILILIIVIATISLIYNSFSISITERTAQFGMLKSVGATNRQLLFSIFYESLLLSLPAVIIGAILGFFGLDLAFWILGKFVPEFSYRLAPGRVIRLTATFRILPLLLATVLCILSTLFSALLPALRAMRMSPIEALRMQKDQKLSHRQLKTSSLLRRMVGVEGMIAIKNQKRERRRHRATVFSLVLSVLLFVSSSSFIQQINVEMEEITKSGSLEDVNYLFWQESRGELARPEKQTEKQQSEFDLDYEKNLARKLASVNGVKESQLTVTTEAHALLAKASYDPAYLKAMHRLEQAYQEAGESPTPDLELLLRQLKKEEAVRSKFYVVFVNDPTFRTYAQKLGLNADSFFRGKTPRGILFNQAILRRPLKSGKWGKEETPVLRMQKDLPLSLLNIASLKDYEAGRLSLNTDGQLMYRYLSEDMAGDRVPQEIQKQPKEVESASSVLVPVMTDQPLLGGQIDLPNLYLPLSRLSQVFSKNDRQTRDFTGAISLKTEDHSQAMKEITQLSAQDSQRKLLIDIKGSHETTQRMVTILGTFAMLFIFFISLIVMANMFNAISTNMILRRRDFAILKTVGMDNRQINRMLLVEGLYYGGKSLLIAVPLSILASLAIGYYMDYTGNLSVQHIPWLALLIAVSAVALVVTATIIYSRHKLDLDHPLTWIKGETF